MSIKELNDISNTYKKLLDSMAKVDSKYSTTYNQPKLEAPESLGLTKLSYEAPTIEEINEISKQYFAANKTKDESAVNRSTESGIFDLSKKAENVLKNALEGQVNIEKQRDSNLKNASYSAQERNLSNSSLKSGLVNKVNDGADSALLDLQNSKNSDLEAIDSQIDYLLKLKEQKLADLNDVYGKKIEDKSTELLAEEQKKQDSVTKYNNTVDQKEAEYKKNLAKQLADKEQTEWQRVYAMLELREKIGDTGMISQKEKEKYYAVRDILDQLPPQEALDMVQSTNAFRTHLGGMYDSLCAYYSNKISNSK